MGIMDLNILAIGHHIQHITMMGERTTLIIDMPTRMLIKHMYVIETCHTHFTCMRDLVEKLYTQHTTSYYSNACIL